MACKKAFLDHRILESRQLLLHQSTPLTIPIGLLLYPHRQHTVFNAFASSSLFHTVHRYLNNVPNQNIAIASLYFFRISIRSSVCLLVDYLLAAGHFI